MTQLIFICTIISILFAGCSTPTSPESIQSVLYDVEMVYDEHGKFFPGGWCGEAALVILGAYYRHISPKYQQVYETRKKLEEMNIAIYYYNYWHLHAQYHRDWSIYQIHQWLYSEGPLIAYLDGWENYLHVVVVIGIDTENIHYLCPQLGYQIVSHDRWNELHQVGEFGVWIIKK